MMTARLYAMMAAALGLLLMLGVPPVWAQSGAVEVESLVPEVLSVRPHDTGSYTQGLVWHEGVFYESAGQYGESDVRQVDPQTGDVLRKRELNDRIFAEGLALVGDRLIQLSWTNEIAMIYDRDTFRMLGVYRYEGEGWGLCYDGDFLYHSDGTEIIDRRDPETFEVLEEILITFNGLPVNEVGVPSTYAGRQESADQLNELECVGDDLYANIWQTDYIVRIDKATGVINAVIDATSLLTPEERETLPFDAVLNGIAYDPEADVFYLTGKYWPSLFEVRFVPAGQT